MSEEHVWVPFDLLEAFMVDVFKGIGVPEAEARVCAEVLIGADKRGIDSHGVGRLKLIYYDRIVKAGIQSPVTEFEVVRDMQGHGGGGRPQRHGHGHRQALHGDGHREGPAARAGHGGGPQLHPLRLRRLLLPDGGGGGDDRAERHQRPAVASRPRTAWRTCWAPTRWSGPCPPTRSSPSPTTTPLRSSSAARSSSGPGKARIAPKAWSSTARAAPPPTPSRSSRT